MKNKSLNVELDEGEVALIVQSLRCKIKQTEAQINKGEILGLNLPYLRHTLSKMTDVQNHFEFI